MGGWVGYRGVEIEVEACGEQCGRGEALILPQGPQRSEEASQVSGDHSIYLTLFNIYCVLAIVLCTFKDLIVISVLWCIF